MYSLFSPAWSAIGNPANYTVCRGVRGLLLRARPDCRSVLSQVFTKFRERRADPGESVLARDVVHGYRTGWYRWQFFADDLKVSRFLEHRTYDGLRVVLVSLIWAVNREAEKWKEPNR